MSASTSPPQPSTSSSTPPNPFLLAAEEWTAVSAPDGGDATPGELARRLDPLVVQTPALKIVDRELVAVRDRIEVMLKRREIFARLVGNIDPDDTEAIQRAIDAAEEQVPDAGSGRLILSMPPQEGKTERVGRRGVLWFLRQFPQLRIGVVSYDGDHAARISYMARADIELFDGSDGNTDIGLRLARNQKAVSRWLLAPPAEGGVYAIGIGGGLTGRPLDLLIIDDPVKDIRAADSVLMSGQAWEWWQTVARPRLAPWAPVILVQTRWHQADLAGRMIAKQEEDEASDAEHFDRWRVISISAQADHRPEKGETDVLGREPGEFMVSARGRTREQWEATKNATAPRFWSALYQGKPTPDAGEVWLRAWWRRYSEPKWSAQPDGTYRIFGADSVLQSWDMAFKDLKSSDYVVGGVWAVYGSEAYLIYLLRRRLSFSDTLEAVKRVTAMFPDARRKLVEDKANGTAVINSLKHKIPGILPVTPHESKYARAEAVSPFIRAGNVLLPTTTVASIDPELSWDVEAFIDEATQFPNVANDDQVDMVSQALGEIYLGKGGQGQMLAAPDTRVPDRINPAARGVLASPVHRRLAERSTRR